MTFSSLADPAELARAQGALDVAWERIAPMIDEFEREEARTRLAMLVESFAFIAWTRMS